MKIDKENIEGISIPEGLEQRLSDTIDGWAADESQRRRARYMSAAYVCVVALIGLFCGIVIFNSFDMTPPQPQPYTMADTYTDPEEAAKAVNYAIQMLQQSFDQSFAELEQVNDDFENIKNTVIAL